MNNYNHKQIENKWQKIWKESELYKTPDTIPSKKTGMHYLCFLILQEIYI